MIFYTIDTSTLLLYIVIINLVFALLTHAVAKSKGLKSGFIIGLAFGIFGLIAIGFMKSNNQNVSKINSTDDKYSTLEKLNALKSQGAITAEEYEKEKAKILNS